MGNTNMVILNYLKNQITLKLELKDI